MGIFKGDFDPKIELVKILVNQKLGQQHKFGRSVCFTFRDIGLFLF